MNTNLLKLFAGNVIVQSDMPKEARLQLLNFVETASDNQIKVFLMDGEIVKTSDDVVTNEIIDMRYNLSGINEKLVEYEELLIEAGGKIASARKTYFGSTPVAQAIGGVSAVSGLAAGGAVATGVGGVGGAALGVGLWALYRKIRSAYDVCTKKCGTYEMNTVRRQYCMAKCKVKKKVEELSAVQKTKDTAKIQKAKASLAKARETFARYQASFKSRGTEA